MRSEAVNTLGKLEPPALAQYAGGESEMKEGRGAVADLSFSQLNYY